MDNGAGRVYITRQTKLTDDLNFVVDDLVLVRFINNGQHYILLDNHIVISPGEAYVEGDITGPGINHTYTIQFVTNASPPAANVPIVYSGNRCEIRAFKRKKDARI